MANRQWVQGGRDGSAEGASQEAAKRESAHTTNASKTFYTTPVASTSSLPFPLLSPLPIPALSHPLFT